MNKQWEYSIIAAYNMDNFLFVSNTYTVEFFIKETRHSLIIQKLLPES